jgi:hypothetical protein
MGIVVEFNPDLALRNKKSIVSRNRKPEECIPDPLEEGKIFPFLKKGQRFYWLMDELPLVETNGAGILSSPIASIKILEVTHFKINGEIMTKGKYQVIKTLSPGEIYFNGINKIKKTIR